MAALSTVALHHDGAALQGEIALPAGPGPRPGVLVMADALGLGQHMRSRASRLAELGYVALATDMYGGGVFHTDPMGAGPDLVALHDAPKRLRARTVAWFDTLKARAEVDPTRIAAIGYCFGGQCVLELARSGADVKAVVSFHGLLTTALPAEAGAIKGQVVVYTGAKDPYAPRAHVDGFQDEMTAAGAHWQIAAFGDAYHAFTDPEIESRGIPGVAYDALVDRLTWAGTLELLKAVF